MKQLTIHNQRLAGYLMLNGYKLLYIEPSKYNRSYHFFVFDDSPEIENAVSKYLITQKQETK